MTYQREWDKSRVRIAVNLPPALCTPVEQLTSDPAIVNLVAERTWYVFPLPISMKSFANIVIDGMRLRSVTINDGSLTFHSFEDGLSVGG
jgi:hypothetical protein